MNDSAQRVSRSAHADLLIAVSEMPRFASSSEEDRRVVADRLLRDILSASPKVPLSSDEAKDLLTGQALGATSWLKASRKALRSRRKTKAKERRKPIEAAATKEEWSGPARLSLREVGLSPTFARLRTVKLGFGRSRGSRFSRSGRSWGHAVNEISKPKLRGSKTPPLHGARADIQYHVINLKTLAALYPDGGSVTVRDLVAKGEVRENEKVEVQGDGDIGVKLAVDVDLVSVQAKKRILRAGGSVGSD